MKNYKKISFTLILSFISYDGLISSSQAISCDSSIQAQDPLIKFLHDEILQDCNKTGKEFSEIVFNDAIILVSSLAFARYKDDIYTISKEEHQNFVSRGIVDYYQKETARISRLERITAHYSELEKIEHQRLVAKDLKSTDIRNMIDTNGCCLKQEFYDRRLSREILIIASVAKIPTTNQLVEFFQTANAADVHNLLLRAQAPDTKVRRLTECPAWVSATRSDLIKKAKNGKYDFDLEIFKSIVIAVEAAFNLVHADLKNNKNKQEVVNCVISHCYSIVCGEKKQRRIKEDLSSQNPSDYMEILQKESLILAKKALKEMPDAVIFSLVNRDNKAFNGHEWDRYMSSYEQELKTAQINAIEAEINRVQRHTSKKIVEQPAVKVAQLPCPEVPQDQKDKEAKVAVKDIVNTRSHVSVDREVPVESFIAKVVQPEVEEADWVKANRLYADLIADRLKQQVKNKNFFKVAKGLSKSQYLKFLYKKESEDAFNARHKEELEIQKIEADRLYEEKRAQKLFEQAEFERLRLERETQEKKAMRLNARLKLPAFEEKSCKTGCLLIAGSALKSWMMYAFRKKEEALHGLCSQKEALEKELEEKNERFKAAQEAMPPVRVAKEDKYKPRYSCFLYRKEIDPSSYRWNPYNKNSAIEQETNLFRKNAEIYRVENPEIGDLAEKIKSLELFIAKKNLSQLINSENAPVGSMHPINQDVRDGQFDRHERPRLMIRGRGR
jgi:hypothetical protein